MSSVEQAMEDMVKSYEEKQEAVEKEIDQLEQRLVLLNSVKQQIIGALGFAQNVQNGKEEPEEVAETP
jgi:hypothetical protein